jgi:predicted signal transduction protein with EAL and GGDEF domain
VRLGAGEREVLVRCTASIGVAVYPVHATEPRALLEHASRGLRAAKAAGRDTWRVSGETTAIGAVTPAEEDTSADTATERG